MDDKKKVYSTTEEYLALLIKGSLEAEGIEVTIANHNDSALTVLSDFELYVNNHDYEAAIEIIAAHN